MFFKLSCRVLVGGRRCFREIEGQLVPPTGAGDSMLVSNTDTHLPAYTASAVTSHASCLGVGFKSRSGDRVSGPTFFLLD